MRVEVFRTDVADARDAMVILNKIHKVFPACSANFDLTDCDRILRIQSGDQDIRTSELITIISDLGFKADVLPDDIPEIIV